MAEDKGRVCTWPETLFVLTSAPFLSSRSMMGSPSAFFKLDAIMRGVQPEPSCGYVSEDSDVV